MHVSSSETECVCVLEAADVGKGCDDCILTFAVDKFVDVKQIVVDGDHGGLLFCAAEYALVGS